MMPPHLKTLGIMKPLGGGDPIPLKKPEVIIGRRPTSDVRLDFENVSGKHCKLKFIQGVWHVRDLGSTNGTTVNGQRLASEHGLMPDDELGVAGHLFMIDYDPVAPTSIMEANEILEEEFTEARRDRSLLEMAGLAADDDARRPRRPERAPERTIRQAADQDWDDRVPGADGPARPLPSDDDFFKMIEEDVEGRRH